MYSNVILQVHDDSEDAVDERNRNAPKLYKIMGLFSLSRPVLFTFSVHLEP